MNVAVLIGSWVLIATMIVGFGAIFLAVVARKERKLRKKYK